MKVNKARFMKFLLRSPILAKAGIQMGFSIFLTLQSKSIVKRDCSSTKRDIQFVGRVIGVEETGVVACSLAD